MASQPVAPAPPPSLEEFHSLVAAPTPGGMRRPHSVEDYDSTLAQLDKDIEVATKQQRQADVERLRRQRDDVLRWRSEDTQRRSGAGMVSGAVMLGAGGVAFFVGLIVAIDGANPAGLFCGRPGFQPCPGPDSTAVEGGAVAMVAGGVVAVAGALLLDWDGGSPRTRRHDLLWPHRCRLRVDVLCAR